MGLIYHGWFLYIAALMGAQRKARWVHAVDQRNGHRQRLAGDHARNDLSPERCGGQASRTQAPKNEDPRVSGHLRQLRKLDGKGGSWVCNAPDVT
jgi:hypothetical protein